MFIFSISFLACITCRKMLSKVKRMKYSASCKLSSLHLTTPTILLPAGVWHRRKVSPKWRRKIDNIKSLPKTKCADRGRNCQWPELEKKFVEWVEENRKSGLAVTRNVIRLHTKKTAQQMNINNYRISGLLFWF